MTTPCTPLLGELTEAARSATDYDVEVTIYASMGLVYCAVYPPTETPNNDTPFRGVTLQLDEIRGPGGMAIVRSEVKLAARLLSQAHPLPEGEVQP